MKVFVVRHSHPESADYAEDGDPELDDEGVEIAQAIGEWMVENEEIPTVLYASPMSRTTQTAEIIAKAISDGGFSEPEIVSDAGIGPQMSIKGIIESVLGDDSMSRVGIISHHESIAHGLRVLNEDTSQHQDIFAQGELRIYKVKRKDGSWTEKKRVQPSDLGQLDHY